MTLKIKLLSKTAQAPSRATPAAAGYDCRADLGGPNNITAIRPGEQAFIHLGFSFEPPQGWTGFLYPRSGLGTKQGLVLANTVGVIDNDYRDELMACVKNTGKTSIEIKHGDRICQLVLVTTANFDVEVVEELSTTDRHGGFGSTGVK